MREDVDTINKHCLLISTRSEFFMRKPIGVPHSDGGQLENRSTACQEVNEK